MYTQFKSTVHNLFSTLSKLFIMLGVIVLIIQLFISGLHNNLKALPSNEEMVQTKQAEIYKFINQKPKNAQHAAAIQTYAHGMCTISGIGCTPNPKDASKDFQASLFGKAGQALLMPLSVPPASGVLYAQNYLATNNLIPRAYAIEGIGFTGMLPFLPLWKAFRNLSLMLLVVVVVVIGFLIMFRFRISPQAVVTIENSLPKLLLTMFYISFSFAIAGALIDLTYLSILFIIEVFSKSNANVAGLDNVGMLHSQFITSNVLHVSNYIFPSTGSGFGADLTNFWTQGPIAIYRRALFELYDLIPWGAQAVIAAAGTLLQTYFAAKMFSSVTGTWTLILGNCKASPPFIGGITVDLCALLVSVVVSILVGRFMPGFFVLLALFIITVGLLFLLGRIFFTLLGAYIQIIINIVFAPIFLIPEALPGRSAFMPWIKRLVGNMAAFPTMVTLFLFIRMMNGIAVGSGQTISFPLLFGFKSDGFIAIITAVLMFMIPDLTKGVIKSIAGDPTFKGGVGLLFSGASEGASTGLKSYGGLATFAKTSNFARRFSTPLKAIGIEPPPARP